MRAITETIRQSAELRGSGCESGRRVNLEVRRASPGTGIVINNVPANPLYARVRENCIVLEKDGRKMAMVEHFLAACYGLGVTDLEVRGDEMPFLDGSALGFVRLLKRAGFCCGHREEFKLPVPVGVKAGKRFIIALPRANGLWINCIFSLPGILETQFFSCRVTPDFFIKNIAPARTFGPAPEVLVRRWRLPFKLKKVRGWFFPVHWRFENEPCRHKVLDLIGDLALSGRWLQAEIVAFNPGHRLNLRLVRLLDKLVRREATSAG